jgi:hypothetical protein
MASAKTLLKASDLKTLRRCSDRQVRELVVGAAKAGIRFRFTRGGAIFYGDNGKCVAVHFTISDHRAAQNLASHFRTIGYHLPKKGSQ